jgi:hypothetical protein
LALIKVRLLLFHIMTPRVPKVLDYCISKELLPPCSRERHSWVLEDIHLKEAENEFTTEIILK